MRWTVDARAEEAAGRWFRRLDARRDLDVHEHHSAAHNRGHVPILQA